MDKKIEVTSKFNGYLVVVEADTRIRRVFPFLGSKMELSRQSIKNIFYNEGGPYILKNYLIVGDKDILEELNIGLQPEDYFCGEDIEQLLTKGTIEQLADAIDYGTEGTRNLIRDIAVKIKLADSNKVKIISDKLGIDLKAILDNSEEDQKEEKQESNRTGRRGEPFVPTYNSDNFKIVNGQRVRVVSK